MLICLSNVVLRAARSWPLVVAVAAAALTPLPVSHVGADAQLSYLDSSLASSFVPAADALQCSLLDAGSGNGAHVRGQDGGWSYAHGGLVYWNYSDTFLDVAPNYVPNTLATTDAAEPPASPSGGVPADETACFQSTAYKSVAGTADVLLPKPSDDCTDWPTRPVATDPSAPELFFIYARNAPSGQCATTPTSYGGAGIGAFDTSTLVATRLDDPPTWQSIPGAGLQIRTGTPLLADDGDGTFVYMFLIAGGDADPLGSTTAVALARVAPDEIATPAAYRYWTGTGWVGWDDFANRPLNDNGHFLWRQPSFGIQAGIEVSWVAPLQKWVAVYATHVAQDIRVRTADHLTGPWSEETSIDDCVGQLSDLPAPVNAPGLPCYSAQFHDEYTSPDGLTMYLSFARNNWPGDYRVYLRRYNLASPVSEWLDADGRRSLAVTSAGTKLGLAFFASQDSLPNFAPVYGFDAESGTDRMYATSAVAPPGYDSTGVAFYVPGDGATPSHNQTFAPVHELLLASGEHAYTAGVIPPDATDEGVAFDAIVPNDDVDGDGVPNAADNCPFDANADQTDSDGDRAGDACDLDDDNDNVPDYTLVPPFTLAQDDCTPTVFYPAHDTDQDGLRDDCEQPNAVDPKPPVYGTDPNNPDTDGDGCSDGEEALHSAAFTADHLPLNPLDPWDFYRVPVPAIVADPKDARTRASGSAQDAQAVAAYFLRGAYAGDHGLYDQDLNHNGIPDGREYDRSPIGPGRSGPPDGVIAASDAQLAFAQFKLGYEC